MNRQTLIRAARMVRLLAALLLAAAGLRAVTAALSGTSQAKQPDPVRVQQFKPILAALPSRLGTAPASAPTHTRPAPGKVRAGASIRVSLIVIARSSRSDVLVNGTTIGQSPFIGEVSCKVAEPIRVQVVPAAGSPRTYTRQCAPGTLRIEE